MEGDRTISQVDFNFTIDLNDLMNNLRSEIMSKVDDLMNNLRSDMMSKIVAFQSSIRSELSNEVDTLRQELEVSEPCTLIICAFLLIFPPL